MKSPLTKLQKEAMKLSLTHDEKRAMHARLMARVNASASKDAEPLRSRTGLYYFFSPQFAMPLAAFLIVALGGGTAYAAQGSLPGDALYTVKTKINEPIRGALAISTEDKIQFHSTVAQTRIEEAEVLASQNRLDTSVSAALESSIEVHIAQSLEYANKLDEENPGQGSKALARNDTSITAHTDILTQLGAGSSSSTTRENSNAIAMKVRSTNSKLAYNTRSGYGSASIAAKTMMAPAPEQTPEPMAMMATEAADPASSSMDLTVTLSLAPSSSEVANQNQNTRNTKSVTQDEKSSSSSKNKKQDSRERTARAYAKKATSTLEELRVRALLVKEASEETKERLEARFERIENLIEQGNEELAREDYDDALDSFEEALDREATLSAFIQAGIKFNKGILGNLLDNDSRWGDRE